MAALTLPKQPRAAWRGKWIWTDSSGEAGKNVYAFFRRELQVRHAARIEIHITADSFYALFLDGERLHRGPARSHFGAWEFDTLSLPLEAGAHCLGVLAHHVGEVNATMVKGRPGWLADVAVTAEPGGTLDLSTGPEWLALQAGCWRRDYPEFMSHFGYPEEIDWCRYPRGWDRTGFAAGGWSAAHVICEPGGAPWGAPVPRSIALLPCRPADLPRPVAVGGWQAGDTMPMPSGTMTKRIRVRQPNLPSGPFAVAASPAGRGRYVTVDFGRTISGYAVLRFAASAPGQTVDIAYDELIDPVTGAVNPERTYARYADRHFLPGGPAEIRGMHPRGFRYVTVDLTPGDHAMALEAVEAEEEVYPFELQPVFNCPDTPLVDLVRQSAQTVRACASDAFMDCPTRERVQWMQDLFVHSLVAMDAYGDLPMPRRSLFEGALSQLPDGRINGFFPSERTNCAFASSTLLWLLLLEEYWKHSGCEEDIRRLLPAAKRVRDLLASLENSDGLIASWPAGQFWDWAPIEGQGTMLLTNAFYVLALERLSAHPLLADGRAGDMAARAARGRAAAHRRFWLPDKGTYFDAILPDGQPSPVRSQFASAAAVLSGICPAERRVDLLRWIIAPEHLGPVPVGENSLKPERDRVPGAPLVQVGTLFAAHWLCLALFENGMDREALDQMRELWLPYRDLYTLPEVRVQHGNTGFCHGWAGGPAFLLPRYVLGLRLLAPKHAAFAPGPADLASAEGRIVGGPEASWERAAEGRYRWRLAVPEGWQVDVAFGNSRETVRGPCERGQETA